MNLIFKVQTLQACGKKQLHCPTCFPCPVHSGGPTSFHSFQLILYLVLLVVFTWKSSIWNFCPPSKSPLSVFSILPVSLPVRNPRRDFSGSLSPGSTALPSQSWGLSCGPEQAYQSYPSSKVWISPLGIGYLLLTKESFSLFYTN